MIYRCKHFRAHELTPPSIYNAFGGDSFRYLRTELLMALDGLWEALQGVPTSLVVNDWVSGGQYKFSGYRTSECPEYKPGSAHSIGAAADIKAFSYSNNGIKSEMAPSSLLDFVMKHQSYREDWALHFRRAEDPSKTITWLHLDVMEHDGLGIKLVEP